MEYSKALIDHFLNPRNLGPPAKISGYGTVGDPSCGDFLAVWIEVEDDRIKDIGFMCRGCPAAIGTASAMTEMARGLTLEEAVLVTEEDILKAVGGLPEFKIHCSNLGASALRGAVYDYLRKRSPEKET
jgi:nitrogen fixation NifU-like protein